MAESTESPGTRQRDEAPKVESPQEVLLGSLTRFYADTGNLTALTDVLKKRLGVSLRVLDWLVTNYCKKKNIVYVWNGQCLNMYANYKAQLRGFSKRFIDPFKRKNKKRDDDDPDDADSDHDDDYDYDSADANEVEIIEWVDADGEPFKTTVGQLNFFRWALQNGVLDYCTRNVAMIEKDMHVSTQHRYAPRVAKRGRRSELSKTSVMKSCSKTRINVTLVFNCR